MDSECPNCDDLAHELAATEAVLTAEREEAADLTVRLARVEALLADWRKWTSDHKKIRVSDVIQRAADELEAALNEKDNGRG